MYTYQEILESNRDLKTLFNNWQVWRLGMEEKNKYWYEKFKNDLKNIETKIIYGKNPDIKILINYLFRENMIGYKRKAGIIFLTGTMLGEHSYEELINERKELITKHLLAFLPETSRSESYTERAMRNEK